jgi:hypothetical protein
MRESEEGKNRDKRIVMMKLVMQETWLKKIPDQESQKIISIGKSSGVIPLLSNPGIGIQAEALMWSHHVTGLWIVFGPSIQKISLNCEVR